MNHQFCSGGRGKQHMGQKNSQREKINYYLREEWESSPPLSRSSTEIQRGETSPDRATRRRVHHMTKPVKKRHTLLLLLKPHVKATLQVKDELLPRHRSLLMLCSWIQWSTQTEISAQCLSLTRHREINLYPSQVLSTWLLPGISHQHQLSTVPRERPPSPSLQSHQEREEHQSWNKGIWTCSDLLGTAADTTRTNKQGLARIKY